ncbi:SGNH/GDSL hydrolase family protein, partial [Acidimicrobiaceae bacterium USS-CC1]|nr:SGNH/GDSL hydrolase family protein [Acidiferrimicrobium australe]
VLPLADDDSRTGGGEAGMTRLARDALAQPGVDRVFLLLGTNDLWFGATAAQVIAGYRDILAQAGAAGVPVIASTLLPRSSGGREVWTPAMEAARRAVNNWILHSGAFAAVIDLAEVVGDVYDGACRPDVMFPPYDSGDNLHPDTAGQVAMADAIPT